MALSGARCIVTGAASGIGRGVAERLLRDGAWVIAVDRDAGGLETLAGADRVAADLTDRGDRERLAALSGVTHLVNAGTIRLQRLEDVTEDDWDATFAINARAMFFLTRDLGERLPAGGAVVNVASGAGKTGTTVEAAVYAATKASVLSMTRTFAAAWARRGVRVNAVCPGVIETPMNDVVIRSVAAARGLTCEQVEQSRIDAIPMGYAAGPAEVTDVIAFLLDDDARYMTGQSINITGGTITY
jgi:NAD(P)-dependent dehydrogenase (short-subunit alcohol dehydrogenase family)